MNEPPADWMGLVPAEAVRYLSEDVKQFIATCQKLHHIYSTVPDLAALDWGPLVGQMAKACERICADFLEPRCRRILSEPPLKDFFDRKDIEKSIPIPDEDRSHNISPHDLRRILGLVKKGGPLQLSGTRTAAVALLAFGRRFAVGTEPPLEVDNPLKLLGSEGDRTGLRNELYRFQKLRNGFIHHDAADRTQAETVRECFTGCVHRLVAVFYGVGDGAGV